MSEPQNLFDISGKVAIITGSTRGIGQAIAERFAQAGAKVVISSRKQDACDETAKMLTDKGYTALAIAAHNGDKSALQNLVTKTVEAFGKVDILVNNAEDSMWQKTLEVNIMGNVWLTQAVVADMRKHGGGKIVNVASVNGIRPGGFQGIYSMTKAAVISITKTLAMELAGDNIQVNAIAPGLIKTKFAQAIWDNENLHEGVVGRTPMGRIGEPDEIAGIAMYLASPASSFATGQVFVVDGGITIPMI